MRIDYPFSDFKLKQIAEITDNELLKKRTSNRTASMREETDNNKNSTPPLSPLVLDSQDKTTSNLSENEILNKPTNLLLTALRYSFLLTNPKSDIINFGVNQE